MTMASSPRVYGRTGSAAGAGTAVSEGSVPGSAAAVPGCGDGVGAGASAGFSLGQDTRTTARPAVTRTSSATAVR